MNLYSTRTMLEAIKKAKPVRTFLRDTFFPITETFVTEQVDVDYKKGKRKMAPFVAPRIGGVVMDRDGFETKSYKPAKIAPERIMTHEDINKRGMGENLYSTRTPEERAKELLANDMIELDDYITRREEWMCREVLFTGKVVMSGEGFEQQIDFDFSNKSVLTGDALWNDPDSDPIMKLREIRLSIIKESGKAPNIAVLASDAAEAFLKHPKVQAYFDKKNISMGVIEPSIKDDAITFLCKIPYLGMEIYSYDEWYLDDAGNEQPMVPAGNVLVASTGMNKRLYGAVTQIESEQFVTIEGERIPKSWVDKDNEVRKLRITSRPLPTPDDVDGWHVLVVL